jgi:hypothetical protein
LPVAMKIAGCTGGGRRARVWRGGGRGSRAGVAGGGRRARVWRGGGRGSRAGVAGGVRPGRGCGGRRANEDHRMPPEAARSNGGGGSRCGRCRPLAGGRRRQSLFPGGVLHAVELELCPERLSGDAQILGCLRLVAAVCAQRVLDSDPLHLREAQHAALSRDPSLHLAGR